MSYEAWVRRALRFREYAGEDLRSGRYDSAAFFAQQAAEFLLKAVLIRATGSRPLSHSISELLSYVAKVFGRSLPEDVVRCAESLESHYVQARYPDARLNDYRRWEAEEAVKCMEVVWGYVREVAGGFA
ncbi:HEPN domain-containing protein [Pyrobaculum ferrireducens]|uniref:HEPN domain-containing protein n=1 Tax=Pyrobaculum ferrireducens TaxID=1104324 RepID=UPI0011E4F576|nr:HEPN domain-containing protein [Pyrobaculum ferrireducens]